MQASIDFGDDGRKYWIQEGGSMTRELCEANLRDLSYFLKTVDTFITDAEHAETAEIARKYEGKVDWAEEHPYWWQDIVGAQLRQSYIVSLVSATEFHLTVLCRNVQSIYQLPLSADDLRGGWIKRSRRFLTKLAGFSSPPEHIWKQITGLYKLRNFLVHNGGLFDEAKKFESIQKLLNNPPGITFDLSFAEIETEFCEHAHEVVSKFFTQLHDQYHKKCDALSQEMTQS